MAPQREADLYGPDIRYSETIRVPVYQTKEVDFTDFVFEDSGLRNIADLYFDMNISEDSDGDGIANNDRDMEQVVATVTPIKVAATFGPYTELIDRDIQVYIEDANNNIGTKQLKFQVYAPTPQISNYDLEEGVFGNINETLDDEPVRLYRYRGGVISKIQTGT
ncbi:MAG: hypothetical protein H6767_06875 [Candidatus Peribacteria bacterium]|nr:MAG: hypothetical protein H6767_06875 [Candidatus Peribacteria bacterium]